MGGPAQDVEIRPIIETDIPAWIAAVDAVAQERQWLARTEAGPVEPMVRFAERNLERGYPHIVAIFAGGLIGWCDITPIGQGARSHVGGLGMGVLAANRGHGIGRTLLDSAVVAARGAGMLRVELQVRSANRAAIHLYERAGFVHEGVLRDAWHLDGEFDDLVAMGLLFPRPER